MNSLRMPMVLYKLGDVLSQLVNYAGQVIPNNRTYMYPATGTPTYVTRLMSHGIYINTV